MAVHPRRLLVFLTTLALLLISIGGVAAAPPQTETMHFKDELATEEDVNPCTGVPGTLTTISSGVIHITEFTEGKHAGEFHITGTVTGRFEIVPDDPNEPSYTGRFTGWFGANQNQKTFVATDIFSVTGKGSDGSRVAFSAVAHVTLNANGEVTVEFEKAHCNV